MLRASPSRLLDLMVYLRLVVHEAQCHSGTGRLLYDTLFRQLTAPSPAIVWGQLHASLYEATILAINQSPASRCLHCLKLDHSTAGCALCQHQNPGDTTEANCNTSHQTQRQSTRSDKGSSYSAAQKPICRRYNFGTCNGAGCTYLQARLSAMPPQRSPIRRLS